MYDLLIKNGRIIDGSGSSGYFGDIGIKDGIILKIGEIKKDASTILDSTSLVVTPGFIDTHSHSDLFLIHEPESKAKILQGITTEIIGQDGLGEAPIRENVKMEWRKYLSGLNGDPPIEWSWNNFDEYLSKVEEAQPSVNVAALVGHGNLRLLAMGLEDRDPTSFELSTMKNLLRESIEQGAIGLSTGLIYTPCVFSKIPELTELCRIIAETDRVFVVHMRNEGNLLLESIDEVISIGIESGARVHISHFKVAGPANWGKSKDALQKLENAQKSGVRISYDQYPYTAGSTFLSSLLPPWVHEGGVQMLLNRLKDSKTRSKISSEYMERIAGGRVTSWDKLMVTYLKSNKNKDLEGLTINEIAIKRAKTEVDMLIDLILEEENQASMASFIMCDGDVERIMAHPLGSICTDGLLLGKPHPRTYGSFPRVLGPYVKKGVINLEEAVRKMTSYPAKVFKIEKRGLISPGYYADITIFHPDKITDTATYEKPISFPKGIFHVIVNGKVAVKNGTFSGERAGKILR